MQVFFEKIMKNLLEWRLRKNSYKAFKPSFICALTYFMKKDLKCIIHRKRPICN